MLEVFDLGELRVATAAKDRAVLDRLDGACRTLGAFGLGNLGLPEGLIERMHQVTLEFFRLPGPVKQRLVSPDGDQFVGWKGAADNRNEFGYPDRKEMFHIGPRVDASLRGPGPEGDVPPVPEAPVWAGCPLWPADLPSMAIVWHEYYRAMQEVAVDLGLALAAALGVSPQLWLELVADNWADLAANFYPPVGPGGETGVRNAVHSDLTMFTILFQDAGGGGGLQMQGKDGHWVSVPPVEGQFLVNVGELLTFLTEGRWWAVPHEVSPADPTAPGADTVRTSIPFFYRPNDSRTIQPLVESSPGAAASARVQVGEWVRQRKLLVRT